MKCLIIAAGQGQRLRSRTERKPLLPIMGVPLIELVVRTALEGGASEFVVVTACDGDRIRSLLDQLAAELSVKITHVLNDRSAEPNGISVLAARQELPEPFLLVMSDHLLDPSIVVELLAHPPAVGEVTLAVDLDCGNPLVDMDDVTRVSQKDGYIKAIGKGIEDYNAFDTGVFYCSPILFDAIERGAAAGDASLTGAMRLLARENRARAFEIDRKFWLDVDNPSVADMAERLLCDGLRDLGEHDGFDARLLVRVLGLLSR